MEWNFLTDVKVFEVKLLRHVFSLFLAGYFRLATSLRDEREGWL